MRYAIIVILKQTKLLALKYQSSIKIESQKKNTIYKQPCDTG